MTESNSSVWADSRPLADADLFAPDAQRDSCGVAFVATLRGTPGRDIVDAGLSALLNLDHRGAFGADMTAGDGAGILTQIPDAFLRDVIPGELPPNGEYAVGLAYLPTEPQAAEQAEADVVRLANQEELIVLAWRDVPVTADVLGSEARKTMPRLRQLVVTSACDGIGGVDLDRLTFRLRKRVQHELGVFFASLSSRTLVYKGMLTTTQLEPFFADLSDPRYASEIALVHARFSTSTEASWTQAQPMRLMAHNGQFTSWRGNRDWMRAREGTLASTVVGDLKPLLPICSVGGSDSMNFDEAVELLHLDGKSLPHAVLMLLPEPWEDDPEMRPDRRAFYKYNAGIVEPWDGPASLNFTDGMLIGTVLDRNATRPSRFWVTEDGLVVLASEAGVLDIDPATVVRKGRVEPGKMFLVDTRQGRIVEDDEIKTLVTTHRPYAQWLAEHEIVLDQAVSGTASVDVDSTQAAFASVDRRPASAQVGNFFGRFRPIQAQVTSSPLDQNANRRSALWSVIGPEKNMLAEIPQQARKLALSSPVLESWQLRGLIASSQSNRSGGGLTVRQVPLGFNPAEAGAGLEASLARLCSAADDAITDGIDILVLTDQGLEPHLAPIPSALATSVVHQHLVQHRSRSRVSLIVQSGDVQSARDLACLLSFGAAAVNPYSAIHQLSSGTLGSIQAALDALDMGVGELMAAFGVSTMKSYRGSLAFEAIGLSQGLLESFFPGTPGWHGDYGLEQIAASTMEANHAAPIDVRDENVQIFDVSSAESAHEQPDTTLRSRFILRPNEDPSILRLCPHRTGVDAAQLSDAQQIRIDFVNCDCSSADGVAPHLDALSLEDLAQLIHDLKNANPAADVQVVLSAQHGVGALAAGVAKAHADSIVVVAYPNQDPFGDAEAAELVPVAVAECHETLLRFGLRGRVRLGVDSLFRSVDDVVAARTLGADFFGLLGPLTSADFSTLVIATQSRLASADALNVVRHTGQSHGLDLALDQQLVTDAVGALERREAVSVAVPVRNVNRSVGTLLGHEVIKQQGPAALDDDTIMVTLTGSAGQSFGAFLPTGVTMRLFGDANDFLGKGLSGGKLIVRPDTAAVLTGVNNVIAGNVVGYGATRGEVFLHGLVGDRFAVRNQGANFVVEGVGDSACQQMSAGTVVILGTVGRNFASGLSGGNIFVLDHAPIPGGHSRHTQQRSSSLDSADVASVIELLQRHRSATGSRIAVELLGDLDRIPARFTKFSSSGLAPERTSRLSSANREL